jgi:hypothetical protein
MESISSVLYTPMAYHNFPYVKKVMIELPYIEFRERCSLSINGARRMILENGKNEEWFRKSIGA